MDQAGYLTVQTSCDSREVLAEMALRLVEDRLIACAQISGPILSIYRWEGKLEQTEEWLLSGKTASRLFQDASHAIRSRHPYRVPEIIAVPISGLSEAYREWIDQQLLPVVDGAVQP